MTCIQISPGLINLDIRKIAALAYTLGNGCESLIKTVEFVHCAEKAECGLLSDDTDFVVFYCINFALFTGNLIAKCNI